ncbi:MAG: phosphoribosyltransferase family protein [Opitutus sp.]
MNGTFPNRTEAGRILAPMLREFSNHPHAIVLALPRGGVPVGYEVARKLHLSLDVLVVRKLGVPGQEEVAMGAIASGGIELVDITMVAGLNISPAAVRAVMNREQAELARREKLYRGPRAAPVLAGKIVILIDDGIATGSTMRAAVRAVKTKRPQVVVVAAPVASSQAVKALRHEVDALITIITTPNFSSVGEY